MLIILLISDMCSLRIIALNFKEFRYSLPVNILQPDHHAEVRSVKGLSALMIHLNKNPQPQRYSSVRLRRVTKLLRFSGALLRNEQILRKIKKGDRREDYSYKACRLKSTLAPTYEI